MAADFPHVTQLLQFHFSRVLPNSGCLFEL
jgi:hypothetical protein